MLFIPKKNHMMIKIYKKKNNETEDKKIKHRPTEYWCVCVFDDACLYLLVNKNCL